jgi:hypothetical protein
MKLPLLSKLFGAHDSMSTLSAGVRAPEFTLSTIDGRQVSLHDLLKKGPVVLAFFKVGCPLRRGCRAVIGRLVRVGLR